MLVAAAVRYLHHAQPVAARVQPHRLGVDRDRTGTKRPFGQIFFVEKYAHRPRIGTSRLRLNGQPLSSRPRRRESFTRRREGREGREVESVQSLSPPVAGKGWLKAASRPSRLPVNPYEGRA